MDGKLNVEFVMGTYTYLPIGTKVKFREEGEGGWNRYEIPSTLARAFGVSTVRIHQSYITAET